MKINYKVVGKRIKTLRISRNITQEQIAYQINSSPSYISNIERGIKKPSLEKLVEIAEVLGVTVNDFIYNASEPYVIYESHELSDIISECTPDSQRMLLGSLTSIIKAVKGSE
ncbi:helix-turn-helix domain-containing protein [Butyrivibrio sp. AC2005]|uniref:helix-turn-helix domain-containing protein n=1 Tax=Butyrivibrio sp. AC2005 TaxID=1280672 RepID=UPI0003FAA78A|nr:helix-turn-helix transcriptional regulator [Butyrivibrio sp. AC2005]